MVANFLNEYTAIGISSNGKYCFGMFAPIRFPTPPARRTRVTEDGSTTDDDEEEEDADTYLIGFALFPNTRRVLLFVFDANDDDEEMENRDARTEEEIMLIARCVPYSSYSLRFALDERVRERERWKVWSYRYLFYPLFYFETALKNTRTQTSSSCPLYLLLRRFARLNSVGIIARGGIRRERCPPPPLLLRIHLLVAATGKTSSFV